MSVRDRERESKNKGKKKMIEKKKKTGEKEDVKCYPDLIIKSMKESI